MNMYMSIALDVSARHVQIAMVFSTCITTRECFTRTNRRPLREKRWLASKADAPDERETMKINAYATSGSSPTQSDVVCENHFSIFLLRPISPAAFAWIEERLPRDRSAFGNAVVVEPRYVWAILVGLQDDGLVVTRG
jgi:hypothetical protein